MQRLLVGFIFSIALLATSTASASVITSRGFPLLDREFPPATNLVIGFGDSVVQAGQIRATHFPLLALLGTRPPFEWPRFDRSRESRSWKDKFPFFSDFPFDSFGELRHHRHDDPPGSTVPEPTTALLFGAGLLGLGLIRRRRR